MYACAVGTEQTACMNAGMVKLTISYFQIKHAFFFLQIYETFINHAYHQSHFQPPSERRI
jgi:hypothetical protein